MLSSGGFDFTTDTAKAIVFSLGTTGPGTSGSSDVGVGVGKCDIVAQL